MKEHDAAVTFDTDAFRAWLDYRNEPTVEGSATNRDVSPLLSAAYQRAGGDVGWVAESTLDMLHSVTAVQAPAELRAWVYGDGVARVKVWTTATPDGGSDGLTGEVTVDGVVLSLGRLTEAQLVPAGPDLMPGYEAAEHALSALSERVCDVAGRYRALSPATGGDVVDAEVVDDDPSSVAYRAAAAAVDDDTNHPAHPIHW